MRARCQAVSRMLGLCWLLAWLPGCASGPSGSEPPPLPPAPTYLHALRTPDGRAELQVAVRRFTSPRHPGRSVWLVGASHLGEPSYYAALQKLLDAQDVVLFEGVRPDTHPQPAGRTEIDRAALDDTLQGSMAKSLGLVFQLTSVDYARPQFRNSDLSLPELEKLVQKTLSGAGQEEGREEATAEFALLAQALSGDSWLNVVANIVLGFVRSSTKLQGLARLLLIEITGSVAADMQTLAAVSPGMQGLVKVLVDARNQKVVQDLKAVLTREPGARGIAIFYGAAHMKDFETRLERELGFRPREERWLTAFGVDLKASGISSADERMVRSMIDWQLESLGQKPPAPSR